MNEILPELVVTFNVLNDMLTQSVRLNVGIDVVIYSMVVKFQVVELGSRLNDESVVEMIVMYN